MSGKGRPKGQVRGKKPGRPRAVAPKPPAPDPGIDEAEVGNLIRAMKGNVASIADHLHVDSLGLRRFIDARPALADQMNETLDRAVDKSVAILEGFLDDEHAGNRLAAAKEFLRSDGGRKRGFGTPASASISVSSQRGGALVLQWLAPESPPGSDPGAKTIEGEVNGG